MPWEGAQSATACSPPPSGRGRGEGQLEAGRALAVPMLPDADVKTALGAMLRFAEAFRRLRWVMHRVAAGGVFQPRADVV